MRTDQHPSPDRRPDRFARSNLGLGNWSLRTKLVVVLLVPAVLAVALGGLRIYDQVTRAVELDRVSRFIQAQGEVAALVADLQQERFRATGFVAAGRTGDPGALQLAGADTDRAGSRIDAPVAGLYQDEPALAGAHRRAQQALARLAGVRTLVLSSNAPADAVISRYSELIGQLAELDEVLLRGMNTAEVSGLAAALTGLALVRDEASVQESMLGLVALAPAPDPADLLDLQSSQARLEQGLGDFRGALDPAQRVRHAGLIAGQANTARQAQLRGVVSGQLLPGPGGLDAPAVDALYQAFLDEVDGAESGVRAELTAAGAAARQTAVTWAVVNAVVLVLALLIGAAVVLLISRQMIGSLRTLRRGAMEVADSRLPDAVARMREGSVPDTDVEAVPVTTREEVGQVARAFDAVHAQAVRLAAEQATLQANVNAMFVNLSRRSQTLVDRQLTLIEELEAGEEDPDQLAHLFQLDHLATRMRRNSENLLVLAGTDLAPRSLRPVPVTEMLQAAVSEVEQYRRIVLRAAPEVAVTGLAGNDLQHLVAELLDNATNFSPPESRVVVSTSRTADGALLVEIADQGVGMNPDELAQLNDQLRLTSDATVEASRRMGLFVVGRLAARHGVDVGLHDEPPSIAGGSDPAADGPGSGLTARVWIPGELLTEQVEPGPDEVPEAATARRIGTDGPSGSSAVDPDATAGAGTGVEDDTVADFTADTTADPGADPDADADRAAADDDHRAGPPRVPAQQSGPLPVRIPGSTSAGRLRRGAAAEGAPGPDGADGTVDDGARPGAGAGDGGTTDERDAEPQPAGPRATDERATDERPADEQSTDEHPDAGDPTVEAGGKGSAGDAATGEAAAEGAAGRRGPAAVRPERPQAVGESVHRLPALPARVPVPGSAGTPTGAPAGTPVGSPAAATGPTGTPTGPGGAVPPIPAVDLPVTSSGDASGLFAPATPAAPLPDPFAVERPRDPFAVPTGPQPAPVAEDPSGWFRLDAPDGIDPAVAGDQGSGRSPWELASRRQAEQAAPQQRPADHPADHPADRAGPRPEPEPAGWTGRPTGEPVDDGTGAVPTDPRGWPALHPTRDPGPAPSRPAEPVGAPTAGPPPVPAGQPAEPPDDAPPWPLPALPRRTVPEDFVTAADTGWRAAEAMGEQSRPPELTAAGLPRRTPRARLVPGTAAVTDKPASAHRRRDAEAVRGRLASYQRGVLFGRESRERPGALSTSRLPADPPSTDPVSTDPPPTDRPADPPVE